MIKINFSQKVPEEITANDTQSEQVSLDKIEYLSSVTDSAGNITLRYQLHRAMPMNEEDPTPSVHEASRSYDEEIAESDLLASQLLNVQTDLDPDMEAAMMKRKAHETTFQELKTIVAGPCKLVGGTDFESHMALTDTHKTMTRMYATLDSLELADGDDAGIGNRKSAMKQDLREMIDDFVASLTPIHPWPPELKEAVTSLMRDLAEKMDGVSPPPVATSDTPSSPTGGYKQRWKHVINLASSHMHPEDMEGTFGFGASKRSKQRQINRLPRQNTESGELDTRFLMTSIDKIYLKTCLIKSTIDPTENAASDGVEAATVSRNVLKDVRDDLTEFLDRWSRPTPKDKLAAEQLPPGTVAKELVYFSQIREKIDTWFSNNLPNGASPSNTPEKSPELTSAFNSPFSKYGNVVFHSNPIVQKSIDDGVAEFQEKTILPE